MTACFGRSKPSVLPQPSLQSRVKLLSCCGGCPTVLAGGCCLSLRLWLHLRLIVLYVRSICLYLRKLFLRLNHRICRPLHGLAYLCFAAVNSASGAILYTLKQCLSCFGPTSPCISAEPLFGFLVQTAQPHLLIFAQLLFLCAVDDTRILTCLNAF